MLKSHGFCRFPFTRNFDQFTIAFYPLRWMKSVSLRLEKYLNVMYCSLNVMFLLLQSFEFRSTTEHFWGSKWFIHFEGPNYQHSFQTQSAMTFNNDKRCLPDQGNVWYDTKKFTETGIDPFIKYLIRLICGDFCCHEGISLVLIRISEAATQRCS